MTSYSEELDDDSPEDKRFAAALDEYYRRSALAVVDPEAFAREFPDIHDELLDYLLTLKEVWLLAPTLNYTRPESPPLETIRYFGDYELLAEIARGGMGVVYRARQVSLNRTVAVKMILAGRLATEDDVRRFRQEAAAAAKLRHPNVVTVFEIGEHEGQHFFSMEFVEGKTLAQVVRDNLLGSRAAAEYAQIIAQTMAAVHAAGLLHRDLKPSNVLIEKRTGLLRISDFGLAKSTELDTLMTGTGQVLGTPSYMAPEQAEGKNDLVGEASDVYAIGAILYELITGRPPFVGETPWDTIWQVRHLEPIAPTALNPKVPRDLETICSKCLQKEIGRRYGTAQELANELGRFLRGEPIHARPVHAVERFWRWCKRNPKLATASGVALAGILAFIVSLMGYAGAQVRHAKVLAEALDVSQQRLRTGNILLAETERDRGLRLCAQGDVDQGCLWLVRSLETCPVDAAELRWSIRINLAAWQRELCELKGIFPKEGRAPTFSPHGERFCASEIEPPAAHIRDTATGELIKGNLPHTGYNVELRFVADKSTLVIRSRDVTTLGTELSLWKEVNDEWIEQPLAAGNGQSIKDLITSNQGRILAAVNSNSHLDVVDVVSGEKVQGPIPIDVYAPGNVALSEDGNRLLSYLDSNRAILMDLESGKRIGNSLDHPGRVRFATFSRDSSRLVTAYELEPEGGNRELVHFQVWDAATGTKLGNPLMHDATDDWGVLTAEFGSSGERLLTATRTGSVRLWDRDGRPLGPPVPHQSSESQLRLSDDGRLFSYASIQNQCRLRDADTGQTVGQALAQLGTIHYVALARDGSHVLTGAPAEGRLWKTPRRGRLTDPFEHGPNDEEVGVKFSRNGEYLLSTNYVDSTARLWNMKTLQAAGTFDVPRYFIYRDAISPDGQWLALGSSDTGDKVFQSVLLWSPTTGAAPAKNLPQYKDTAEAIAFSGDGKLLITVGDGGKVFVYDIDDDRIRWGPLQHPMKDFDGQSVAIRISSDNQRLAVYSNYEGPVSLWDLERGTQIGASYRPSGEVDAIEFSPQGKKLVVAGEQIAFLDSTTATPSPLIMNVDSFATCAAFHPEGNLLATGHVDRTVRLWNSSTGEPAGPNLPHIGRPGFLQFLGTGELLLAGTDEGGCLWDPATGCQVGRTIPAAPWMAATDKTIAGTHGKNIYLWEVPQPVPDDVAEIKRKVEVATGFTLDHARQIKPLSLDAWEQRRRS